MCAGFNGQIFSICLSVSHVLSDMSNISYTHIPWYQWCQIIYLLIHTTCLLYFNFSSLYYRPISVFIYKYTLPYVIYVLIVMHNCFDYRLFIIYNRDITVEHRGNISQKTWQIHLSGTVISEFIVWQFIQMIIIYQT